MIYRILILSYLEYLGCFLDAGSEHIFTISPGDYLPDDLSPISCMLACGKHWKIAGIRNGNICLCSTTKPTIFHNENHCNAYCSGVTRSQQESAPQCGGVCLGAKGAR